MRPFYNHKLNKIKHCLVIVQQSIGSCVNIVLPKNVFDFNPLSKLSDIIKMNLFCHSLTLSSWHFVLPWKNCDYVRNVEGVWIHFDLTVYLIFYSEDHAVLFYIWLFGFCAWTPINVNFKIV